MNKILTADRVEKIFTECLFNENESTDGSVKAEGIMTSVGFHPGRLAKHQAEIISMLNELPDEFQQSKGGGWTFLNACNDKHGNQWTGLHVTMEQLFLLGIGINKVKFLIPRNMWDMLPGGMPYVIILQNL